MGEIELLYVAYFATFVIVAETTLPLVTEAFNRLFTLTNPTIKSITSWVIPVALMYFGWGVGHYLEGSFLVGLDWWHPAVLGGIAGSLSNLSWTSITWVKQLINWVLDRIIGNTNKK